MIAAVRLRRQETCQKLSLLVAALKATSQPTMEERLLVRGRPKTKPVLQMQWKELLFLHWSWDAREIQATLPAGLFADTFDGKAWLAIVPFFMRKVHPMGLPCLPWLSSFLELNVRTYVHDGAGVPGVWFYSLACNQPLAVELARRFFHLNYVHARMGARIDTHGMFAPIKRGGTASRRRLSATAPLEQRRLPSQVPSNSFLSSAMFFFPPDETGNSALGAYTTFPTASGAPHWRSGVSFPQWPTDSNALSGLPTTRWHRRTSKCKRGRSGLILPFINCGRGPYCALDTAKFRNYTQVLW